ncbi:MAG: hypothetical protein LBN27_06010 [Prevotellaceae bacterium]|jgi:hypothetical protein|nr:hypothetical protein [Prevotellaceae bacterium]
METITLTYNEKSVQARNLLNYILSSGFLVPKIENEPALIDMPFEDAPYQYSSVEKMKDAVLQSREDIRNGRVITIEELRAKHPRI